MTDIFLKLVDMSLAASWIVLAVIAARLVLKKAPKWMMCALWALVALRLVCPFSFESVLSLVPELPSPQTTVEETLPETVQNMVWEDISKPGDRMTVTYPNKQGKNEIYEVYLDEDGTTKAVEPRQVQLNWPIIACSVWLAGMTVMGIYAAISYLHIRKKVQVSIELGNGVYICDYIDTPFILGLVKPKIYLPSAMAPGDAPHVLAHERAHLRRKDHWWKPLGFALLVLHWFNPLLWAAYILLCRDIELACDERVIKDLNAPEKKAYSEALLKCSVPRHMILACPLAFGEVGVKQRVKSVLNYKKPGFWVLLVSVLIIVVVAVCFLTEKPEMELEFPFEKDYWTAELVYSYGGSSLWEAPSELLETINLSRVGYSSVASYHGAQFTEITLTESNFDAYFAEGGVWSSTSAKRLRRGTVNAWVLHDTSTLPDNNFHNFYYLLQQKNGDLYLTRGSYWNTQRRPGSTYVEWVVKLEDALTGTPFTDGDNPIYYTKNLDFSHLEPTYPDFFAWLNLTAYQEDGSPKVYEKAVYGPTFVDLLHSLSREDFSLGQPIRDVEVVLQLDVGYSDALDITLRYGEGKVDMVFSESATWKYADTGERAWIIESEALEEFFFQYSRNFTLPSALLDPQDPYQWCQAVSVENMEHARLYAFHSTQLNRGYYCTAGQVREFLAELKDLPASAFVPSSFDMDTYIWRDGGFIGYTWKQLPDAVVSHYSEVAYADGAAYFSFRSYNTATEERSSVVWEIRDEDFAARLASHLETPNPRGFRTTEYPLDTITVSHGYANITLDVYDFMEYEVVEHTDEDTPFGIRFRPRAVDEGWLFLAFFPSGFTPDPDWAASGGGGYYSSSETNYYFKTYYSNNEASGSAHIWRAEHFHGCAGDYAVLNEGADPWFTEYSDEINYLSFGEESAIASGCLTLEQIMEIASPILQDANVSIQAYGNTRTVYPTFDYLTGIWTFATKADEKQESVVVLRMDAQGNVIP